MDTGKLKAAIERKRGEISPTAAPADLTLFLRQLAEEMMVKAINDLAPELRTAIDSLIAEAIQANIEVLRGDPGEPGVSPVVDLDDLAEKAAAKVPPVVVDENSIAEKVAPRVIVKTDKINEKAIAERAASMIEVPTVEEVVARVLEQMPEVEAVELPSTDSFLADIHARKDAPIKITAIEGLSKLLREIQRAGGKMIHGGGTTIKIGTAVPGIINFVRDEDLTVQGPGTTFTLAHTPIAGTTKIYRGGARQSSSNGDYTRSGATITLATALVGGEVLISDYEFQS